MGKGKAGDTELSKARGSVMAWRTKAEKLVRHRNTAMQSWAHHLLKESWDSGDKARGTESSRLVRIQKHARADKQLRA